VAIREVQPRVSGVDQATEALTELKQRLESDPRPRYVVIKEGMDHGPFNAVELLQQIASNTFTEDDLLRETFSKDERLINDWPEFAPFAENRKGRALEVKRSSGSPWSVPSSSAGPSGF
jgi:hypothetical protein